MFVDFGDRVQAVDDRLATSGLRARHYHYPEDGRYDDLIKIFTEDGEFQGLALARGHEEMRAFFPRLKDQMASSWHRSLTEMTDLDADRAAGLSYFDCPAVMDGTPKLIAGRYHDDYVRIQKGWRFSRRVLRFAYLTPLSEGGHEGALPAELAGR